MIKRTQGKLATNEVKISLVFFSCSTSKGFLIIFPPGDFKIQ